MADTSRASGSASATSHYHEVYGGESAVPLVFDGGSMNFRAGFAGFNAPHFTFPTAITQLPEQSRVLIDFDAMSAYPEHTIRPIERGVITNLDYMERVIYNLSFCALFIFIMNYFRSGITLSTMSCK